jgi:hypothetical protein
MATLTIQNSLWAAVRLWNDLGLLKFSIIFAIPAIVDVAGNISCRISSISRNKLREDTALLLVVAFFGFVGIFLLNLLPHSYDAFVDYSNINDAQMAIAQSQQAVILNRLSGSMGDVLCILWVISFVWVFFLVWQQKRQLMVWVPLALLSPFGGLIWLLARGGRRR